LRVGIAQDETDGGEEVALAGAIAADNNVGLVGKGLDNGLRFVAASQGQRKGFVRSFVQTDRQSDSQTVSQSVSRPWIGATGCLPGHSSPFEALDDDLLDKHDG
jgi:hypothetical protein